MNDESMEKVFERLDKLEAAVFGQNVGQQPVVASSKKPLTLPELARKKSILNGQHKIATIVGYNEKVINEGAIPLNALKAGWKDGKFAGSYNSALLLRAIKDGLVRDLKDGTYDLTQGGENFFDELLSEAS